MTRKVCALKLVAARTTFNGQFAAHIGDGKTRMCSDVLAVCPCESVTCTVKLEVTVIQAPPTEKQLGSGGVPEITPVAESSLRPTGKLPDVTRQVNGGVPAVGAGSVRR
jgi:hypothetical protein